MVSNKMLSAQFALVLLLVAGCALLGSGQEKVCRVAEAGLQRGKVERCTAAGSVVACTSERTDSYKNLPTCASILGNTCIQNITLDMLSVHEPIKNSALCESENTQLTVNVNEHAHDEAPEEILMNSKVNTLKLRGVSPTRYLDKLKHLSKIAARMQVENLIIESIGVINPSLPNFNMIFTSLESLRMSDVTILNLLTGAMRLSNVKNVQLSNLNVEGTTGTGAIGWIFQEPCPNDQTVSFNINKVHFSYVQKEIITVQNNCPKLQMDFKVRNVAPTGLLTSDMFRNVLIWPRDERSVHFSYDPIRCCDEQSKWLFMPNVMSNRKLKLDVLCSDLGNKPIQDYNETSRNIACQQAPVPTTLSPTTTAPPPKGVPTQLIIIGLIAGLILVLLIVFIYLRVSPSSEGPVRVRSQPGSPPAPAPKESISIPSGSLPSSSKVSGQQRGSSMMAKSAKSTKSTKSTQSTKSTKSNWSKKRIGKSKRASKITSPSNIRSVRSS